MKNILGFLCFTLLFTSCGGSSKHHHSSKKSTDDLSAEAQTLTRASKNMASAADDDNGVLLGGPDEPGLFFSALSKLKHSGPFLSANKSFDAEADCKNSGGLDDQWGQEDDNWALFTIYCNMMKRPDGPDTARGAIDRAAGWLCALGDIKYDGKEHEVEFNITEDCFSSSFVTMVKDQMGGTTATATYKGKENVTGIGPDNFDKYFTFEIPDVKTYTFLVKDDGDEKAIAVRDGLPGDETGDAFAVYMDRTAGTMKIEGRFSPEEDGDDCGDTNCRHFRLHIEGEMDDNFKITNVDLLSFMNVEESYLTSISGTPSAGRTIRFLRTSDDWDSTDAGPNDGDCIGEDGAACTGNDGLIVTDGNGYFAFAGDRGTDYTAADVWFEEDSWLGSSGDLTDAADSDIW